MFTNWYFDEWFFAGLMAVLAVTAGAVIIAFGLDIAKESERREWVESHCELMDTRIEGGFGASTVGMYTCDDGTTHELRI
jgi:hypothetical protein